MARDRKRTPHAARPALEGASATWQLEPRLLLSTVAARRAALKQAREARLDAKVAAKAQVGTVRIAADVGIANGGRAAVLTDTDGELYVVHVAGGGTVRAKAVRGGQFDLFLFSTNNSTVVTIDPQPAATRQGGAHDFPAGTVIQDDLVHIRNITVANGRINQLLGYKTADVSGAIEILGKASPSPTVDRIAFYALKPGASIRTFGDVNTLNVFDTVTLDTGPGIRIGRDLNWFLIGSNVTLTNGASIIVGRDIGLAPQGPKGSSFGGQGGLIQGNLVVGTGSTVAVGRAVDAPIIVQGSSLGISNVPANVQAATIVIGTRG